MKLYVSALPECQKGQSLNFAANWVIMKGCDFGNGVFHCTCSVNLLMIKFDVTPLQRFAGIITINELFVFNDLA